MNIVHLCLCGPMTDDWTYQENLLTKYHSLAGHTVSVIASQWIYDDKGNLAFLEKTNYFDKQNVKVIRLPIKNGNIETRLKRYVGLKQAIARQKPDVMFIHGGQFLDLNKAIDGAKKLNVGSIYIDNHCDYSNSASNWLSINILHKIIWRYVMKRSEPYVKKFYGVLPARVDFLKELYHLPEEKCELLVMGADDELVEISSKPEIKKKIRKQYNLSDNDFVVMTGGKIDGFKKQTLLLMDAVNRIKNVNLKLVVFGSVTPELMQEVKKRCSDRVKYIGWLQAKDSYQYFAASDLVVFPGRHSVFWEQVVGQGIPMIVKEWKGTKHVDLGGNVRFLTQDSVDEIQFEIERLLNNPKEYAKMKKVAREEGMKVFSYRDIAKRAIEGCI